MTQERRHNLCPVHVLTARIPAGSSGLQRGFSFDPRQAEPGIVRSPSDSSHFDTHAKVEYLHLLPLFACLIISVSVIFAFSVDSPIKSISSLTIFSYIFVKIFN